MPTGLQYSDLVKEQTAPGFNLATAAQAATLPAPISPFSPGGTLTVPSTGVTGSSTVADNTINNLGVNIGNLATNSPAPLGPDLTALKNSSTEAQKIIKDQQTALEQRRQQAIADIENSFNQTQAATELAQKKETGSTSMGLARIGGFDSQSGNAVLTNLANTQRAEITTLQQKRQAAINQAQSAYDDKSFSLASSLASEVKNLDSEIYKRSQDYNSMLNNAAQEARLQATDNYNRQKDTRDFLIENNITQPYYTIGGVIFNSQTQQPEYENVGGEIRSLKNGKAYGDEKDFFADVGITSFDQIQSIAGSDGTEQDLVIKYMLDYKDAGILPTDSLAVAGEKLKRSPLYLKSIKSGSGEGDSGVPKDAKVRDFLYEIKKKNPSKSWEEQWDEGARFLQEQEGLNPTNYDKVFWEIFHPQGVRGYEKEYKKISSQDELLNAFYTAMGVTPPQ